MKQLLSFILVVLLVQGICMTALAEGDAFIDRMDDLFGKTDMEYWPETRWWLAEGSHTDETLKECIDELYENGVGAVEFVTLDVSQLSDDPELNDRYAWGSEEWIHDSRLIIEYCTEKGMGVSFTSGTHWGTANLINITPDSEQASQELGYTTRSVAQGETFSGELTPTELTAYAEQIRLVKVIAAKVTGAEKSETMLDPDSVVDVTDSVSGPTEKVVAAENTWTIDFKAEDGEYVLFSFWQYGTSEYSSPAVGEGRSYTINYFSDVGADAWIEYWDEYVVPDDLKAIIQENGDVSLYMDSLELQTAGANTTGYFWTEDYLDEFEARSGYDLTPYLPIIITTSTQAFATGTMQYPYTLDGEAALCTKIRNDLMQVNTELYMEKCLDKLRAWGAEFDLTVRAEVAYGEKIEISQPIGSVDYVETESFEFGNEIDSYRLMSGGAHIYNIPYSSETGATMGGNYKYTNYTWRNVFYTQFISGIQRTIMHGYASSYGPEGTVVWPGFEGMSDGISLRYSARQPASIDFYSVEEDGTETGLSAHLANIQSAMRQGVVRIDLAILRTDYNVNNIEGMSKSFQDNKLHVNEGIYWQDMTLQNSGYTYDYFSPLLLEEDVVSWEDGLLYGKDKSAAYQAVILYQDDFPYECVDELESMAAAGVPIIFVDTETVEQVRPGVGMSFGPPSDTAEEVEVEEIDDSPYSASLGWRTNESAALHTTFNDATDEALQEAIARIRSYANVVSVTDIADTYDALIKLGVRPRAAYAEENQALLTSLRQDGDTEYLLVYNYQYSDVNEASVYYDENEVANCATEISFDGIAKPYVVDTWSGKVSEAAKYSYEDGRTIFHVDLAPGDVILFALDCGIDEADVAEVNNVKAVSDAIELDSWNLTVESWTPGEAEYRYEYVYEDANGETVRSNTECGDDTYTYLYTTSEYHYATNKTDIDAGRLDALVAWKELDAVGDQVSGVGTYTAAFEMPEIAEGSKIYFDVDSFCGGTARVRVNGQNVFVNMNTGRADITGVVVPGENAIEVRVTTTLTNALNSTGWFGSEVEPLSYGMVGHAHILVY